MMIFGRSSSLLKPTFKRVEKPNFGDFRSPKCLFQFRTYSDEKNNEVTTKKIKIYTKTGDGGMSSLFNGERRPKTDLIFDALGNTDELNSFIGLSVESLKEKQIFKSDENGEQKNSSNNNDVVVNLPVILKQIQSRLIDAGAAIATPITSSSDAHISRAEFPSDAVNDLEKWIDQMEDTLPPLRQFILPGGGISSCYLHTARSIARRAERSVVQLHGDVSPSLLQFFNRLSDFFFVSARYVSQLNGIPDTPYKKPRTPSSSSS